MNGVVHRNWFIAGLVVVLLIALGILVRPAFIGYSIYDKIEKGNYSLESYGGDVEELESQLLVESTKRSSVEQLNEKLSIDLAQAQDELATCGTNLEVQMQNTEALKKEQESQLTLQQQNYDQQFVTLNTSYEQQIRDQKQQYELRITSLNTSCSIATQQLTTLQQDYSLFIANIVKSTCCKQKVDDPSLKYYEVRNGKLYCLSQGKLPFSCSFE